MSTEVLNEHNDLKLVQFNLEKKKKNTINIRESEQEIYNEVSLPELQSHDNKRSFVKV